MNYNNSFFNFSMKVIILSDDTTTFSSLICISISVFEFNLLKCSNTQANQSITTSTMLHPQKSQIKILPMLEIAI